MVPFKSLVPSDLSPFDAPWLELVESLMLACIELAEMLIAGLSSIISH
jgi:hypothetical protein